jgi:SGNH domain (fused to AT3 domains)
VRRDPLAAAAGALRSPRVKLIDLADRFCDETRCFSVIGGALVHHDRTHMTTAFSATLGPFILRALDG